MVHGKDTNLHMDQPIYCLKDCLNMYVLLHAELQYLPIILYESITRNEN